MRTAAWRTKARNRFRSRHAQLGEGFAGPPGRGVSGVWFVAFAVAVVTLTLAHEFSHALVVRWLGGRVLGLGHIGIYGPGVRLDLARVSIPGRICVHLSGMATEALIAVAVGLAQTAGWLPNPWSGALLIIAAIDITASALPFWRLTDGAHAWALVRAGQAATRKAAAAALPPTDIQWGDEVVATAGTVRHHGFVVSLLNQDGTPYFAVQSPDTGGILIADADGVASIASAPHVRQMTPGQSVQVSRGAFAGHLGTLMARTSVPGLIVHLPAPNVRIVCGPHDVEPSDDPAS